MQPQIVALHLIERTAKSARKPECPRQHLIHHQPRIGLTVEGDRKLVEHVELGRPAALALRHHLQPVPPRLRTQVVRDRKPRVLFCVRARETKLRNPRHEAQERRIQTWRFRHLEIAGDPAEPDGHHQRPDGSRLLSVGRWIAERRGRQAVATPSYHADGVPMRCRRGRKARRKLLEGGGPQSQAGDLVE